KIHERRLSGAATSNYGIEPRIEFDRQRTRRARLSPTTHIFRLLDGDTFDDIVGMYIGVTRIRPVGWPKRAGAIHQREAKALDVGPSHFYPGKATAGFIKHVTVRTPY